MYVTCHSCARVWEVVAPEEWSENGIASCGYCGHAHTLEMCKASQTVLPPRFNRRNHENKESFLDALADGASELDAIEKAAG